jgi:hypothetical protein
MTGTMAGIALGTAAAGVLATFVGVGGVFIVATVAVLASIVVWTHRATTVIPRGDGLSPIPVSADRECLECGC